MRRMRILSLFVVLSLLFGVVAAGCAQPTPEPTEPPAEEEEPEEEAGPLKIAMLAAMSGDVKTFGEGTKRGVDMAVSEWNAKGGVLGRQIEVVVGDTKCDAQEAANVANKVINQDQVNYIVGAVCSSASIPISEIANPAGVVQISPPSTNPQVTIKEDGSNKEYVFRACFLDPFQGEVDAAFAMDELGAQTAASLYDVGNDYVKGLAEYFKASFEEFGGEMPVFEAYTKEDTDFSALLTKVAEADVDVLFLPDYYNKVNVIAKQAKEKGIEATMLGADGWDSPDLDLEAVDGAYFSNHYSPYDPRPIVQDFVSSFQGEYGMDPDFVAVLAYDATNVLLQAIENAGVDDPAVVKDELAAIEFEGVAGDIRFDEKGDPIKKAAISHITGGEIEFVKFVAPPGGEGAEEEEVGVPVAEAPGFPVKIAKLFPMSGDVKTFGVSSDNGVELAFEEARAAGWEIDAVLGDTKCDAQEAANVANKAITQDKVNYILGAVCSSSSIPISEIANPAGILQMSPTSTNPQVTINEDGSNKEYVFRACFLDPFQGEVNASFAINDLGAESAAVLYDVGNDYVKGLAEYYKASFEEMGGEVPVFEAYTKEDTDFSALLTKVAEADVDVLFLPDYYSKVNVIAKQAKEKGIEATLQGADGWDSPLLETEAVEGGYFSNHYSPADPRPIVQAFVANYEAEFGQPPDALAALAYDAARMLLQAITEAGVDDPAAVKDALMAIEYDGVAGTVVFNDVGDPQKTAAINTVENGEVKFVKFVAP
ncbi:MAG: ABC transporter substrate-binding protein [Anaerolineae bacterium]|jgi:branched-chain amino acid transport system substrate-binding protein